MKWSKLKRKSPVLNWKKSWTFHKNRVELSTFTHSYKKVVGIDSEVGFYYEKELAIINVITMAGIWEGLDELCDLYDRSAQSDIASLFSPS